MTSFGITHLRLSGVHGPPAGTSGTPIKLWYRLMNGRNIPWQPDPYPPRKPPRNSFWTAIPLPAKDGSTGGMCDSGRPESTLGLGALPPGKPRYAGGGGDTERGTGPIASQPQRIEAPERRRPGLLRQSAEPCRPFAAFTTGALDGEVVLTWSEGAQAIETWKSGNHVFEGYNVYQFEGRREAAVASIRIATFDVEQHHLHL